MSEGTAWCGRGRTTYECVDRDQDSVSGTQTNTDGAVLYHVEASCEPYGLPCPPYNNYKELPCVVCTK